MLFSTWTLPGAMVGFFVSFTDVEQAFSRFMENLIGVLPRLALAVLAFVAFVVLAKLSRRWIHSGMVRATKDERAGNAMGALARYAVLFLGVVVALAIAGVSLSAMMIGIGAVGFALAFALQETIADFISGMLILITRPFARQDTVEINGEQGNVEQINVRSTKLRTFDGLKIEVPNRSVLANNITVFSEHPKRRFEVAVGIGYDADIGAGLKAAQRAAASVEEVLEDPPVEAFVSGLGGSSVDLIVRFWVPRSPRGTMLAIQGEVVRAVKEALDEEAIDIPFPIRTVYLHEEANRGLGEEGGEVVPPH